MNRMGIKLLIASVLLIGSLWVLFPEDLVEFALGSGLGLALLFLIRAMLRPRLKSVHF